VIELVPPVVTAYDTLTAWTGKDAALLSEGRCPVCSERLDLDESVGWCPNGDGGWSMTRNEVTFHWTIRDVGVAQWALRRAETGRVDPAPRIRLNGWYPLAGEDLG
jgi:hypothetical protein